MPGSPPTADRRSSPQAPQGFVLVSAVLVGLLVVAALLAGNLRSGGGDGTATSSTSSTAPGGSQPVAAHDDASSPTIMGPGSVQRGSTTAFVSTTLLVTTTSSTTTTSVVEGGSLDVRGGPLSLDAGGSGTLRVSNTGAAPLRWGVASSSADVTARPTGGTLEPAATVTVRVSARRDAPDGGATLTFVSGGGVKTVRVTVGSAEPGLSASLSFSPAAPSCATPVAVTLAVTGSATSAQGQYVVGNNDSSTPLPLTKKGSQWSATIPAQPAGARVRVSATVSGAGGSSASTAASYVVVAGPC